MSQARLARLATTLGLFLACGQPDERASRASSDASPAGGGEPAPASAAREGATRSASAPRAGRFENGKIIADTFRVRHHLDGSTLTLVLDTDLPDNTDLMVGVGRLYKQRGDQEDYVIDFFSEKSKVGAWKLPRQITLDNDAWRAKLEEQQRIMARVGEPFEIRSIADEVGISLTVPVNQEDPRFGRWNADLIGSAVEQRGNLRIIEFDSSVPYPLQGGVRNVRWADPLKLEVSKTYVLGDEVSLMPELDPVDPLAAIERIVVLPAGSRITVLGVRSRAGAPWYQAEANGADGRALGSGWVNSTGLIGQDVREWSGGR